MTMSKRVIKKKPADYAESIKASAHVLTVIDSCVKKEMDVYPRQISISKNYIWIASLFIALAIGIFDRQYATKSVSDFASWMTWVPAGSLGLVIIASACTFFLSIQVFWNSRESYYVDILGDLFKENERLNATPRNVERIYTYYVQMIGTLSHAFGVQLNESVRRGRYLRWSGVCIRVAFSCLILNILFYLMEVFT
ncbi:MAG: hypothetical protein SOR95_08335 [Sutterella sp.]|nr:hypothetical protein [Sutterella sp.]